MAEGRYVLAGEEGWALGLYATEIDAWMAAAADAHRVHDDGGEEDEGAPLRWVIERFEGLPSIVTLHAHARASANPNGVGKYVITDLDALHAEQAEPG